MGKKLILNFMKSILSSEYSCRSHMNFVGECYDCHWTVQYVDFVFQFKSYNTSFTNTEIWIRFTFLFLTFIVTVSVSPCKLLLNLFLRRSLKIEGNNCVLCNFSKNVQLENFFEKNGTVLQYKYIFWGKFFTSLIQNGNSQILLN